MEQLFGIYYKINQAHIDYSILINMNSSLTDQNVENFCQNLQTLNQLVDTLNQVLNEMSQQEVNALDLIRLNFYKSNTKVYLQLSDWMRGKVETHRYKRFPKTQYSIVALAMKHYKLEVRYKLMKTIEVIFDQLPSFISMSHSEEIRNQLCEASRNLGDFSKSLEKAFTNAVDEAYRLNQNFPSHTYEELNTRIVATREEARIVDFYLTKRNFAQIAFLSFSTLLTLSFALVVLFI